MKFRLLFCVMVAMSSCVEAAELTQAWGREYPQQALNWPCAFGVHPRTGHLFVGTAEYSNEGAQYTRTYRLWELDPVSGERIRDRIVYRSPEKLPGVIPPSGCDILCEDSSILMLLRGEGCSILASVDDAQSSVISKFSRERPDGYLLQRIVSADSDGIVLLGKKGTKAVACGQDRRGQVKWEHVYEPVEGEGVGLDGAKVGDGFLFTGVSVGSEGWKRWVVRTSLSGEVVSTEIIAGGDTASPSHVGLACLDDQTLGLIVSDAVEGRPSRSLRVFDSGLRELASSRLTQSEKPVIGCAIHRFGDNFVTATSVLAQEAGVLSIVDRTGKVLASSTYSGVCPEVAETWLAVKGQSIYVLTHGCAGVDPASPPATRRLQRTVRVVAFRAK